MPLEHFEGSLKRRNFKWMLSAALFQLFKASYDVEKTKKSVSWENTIAVCVSKLRIL
jgi:hypothetical protein